MNEIFLDIQTSALTYIHKYNYRRGQALMEALYRIEPKAYRKIVDTLADPFYNDKLEPDFWVAVEKFFNKKG